MEAEEVVVLKGCNIQLSVLEASRSLLEPSVQRPGTPLEPGEVAAAAAAEVCLRPCASPRQMGAGTRAQGPGLLPHVVVHRQWCRRGSPAGGAENGWG